MPKKNETGSNKLIMHTENFINDLECAREMFQIVMPVLNNQDKKRQKKIDEFIQKVNLPKTKKEPLDFSLNGIKEFLKDMRKLNRGTDIFRKNVIIGFVSRYDELIGNLVRSIFKIKPNLIISDKVLNIKEVIELRSVKNIKERFVENEVDSFLRNSHLEHFKQFEKYFSMPFRNNLSIFPDFIELTERRNLFTHCGGIVSSHYLNVCNQNSVIIDEERKIGKKLGVNDSYVEKAFKILFEVGLKLGQTIYRKNYPDALEIADMLLNSIGFDYMTKKDWDIAEIVFDYAVNLEPKWISNDLWRRFFIINRCIVLKHTNRKNECYKILGKEDWSSQGPKFQLAILVLNEKWNEAEKIMSSMNGKEPFGESDFREWPIFIEFRKKKQFKRAFKKLYGKDLDSPPTKSELEKVIKTEKDVNNKV